MSNPPKQKGTAYETEVLRAFVVAGFMDVRRTQPGAEFDINVPGRSGARRQVDALITRPDRGQSLVTITLPEFLDLLGYRGYGARVECKRFARLSHHTIFEGKFGRAR